MPDLRHQQGQVDVYPGVDWQAFAVLLLMLCALLLAPVSAQDSRTELDKDPFSQPDLLKYQPPVPPPQAVESTDEEDLVLPAITLEATLLAGDDPAALINGTLVQVGEKIEDMKLIWVGPGQAVLRFARKNYLYNLYEIESDEAERR